MGLKISPLGLKQCSSEVEMRRKRFKTTGVTTKRRGRYIIKTVYKKPVRRRKRASGFFSKFF